MKVNRINTEYMCVNERQDNGTVRMQEEVAKVDGLKSLGSSGGARGVPGVLAPLDQAPRTTKIDILKHICSFTSHYIFQSRFTYVSR